VKTPPVRVLTGNKFMRLVRSAIATAKVFHRDLRALLSKRVSRVRRLTGYGYRILRRISGSKASHFAIADIKRAEIEGGKLWLSGYLHAKTAIPNATIITRKFREEVISFSSAARCEKIGGFIGFWAGALRAFDIYSYRFSACLDLPWELLPSSIYGISMQVAQENAHVVMDQKLECILSDDENEFTFCVFLEPSTQVVRIEHYKFGKDVVKRLSEQKKRQLSDKVVCIVGEYTNTARDNGRALFEELRCREADILAHYVVERENIDGYSTSGENVLEFGSVAHLEACLNSVVCAFTHHRSYVYPNILRLTNAQLYNSTRTLFLQHGITAMKRSVIRHYSKARASYSAVSVCSSFERSLFLKYFGYSESEVFVTGFPRLDKLCAGGMGEDIAAPVNLVVFPTWREGIEKKSEAEVAQSTFFQNWHAALEMIRAKTSLRVILVLHPMLQRHSRLFGDCADQIVYATEFQSSLARANCLLTDYSSVAFDALFLNKPVLLFQFDQKAFGLKKSALIKIPRDLPGQAVLTTQELLAALTVCADSGWVCNAPRARDMYFNHRDAHNTRRTATLIRTLAMM
jgi:CDP-glycerol glycerophosphotransferase (TagB/SpsB family)